MVLGIVSIPMCFIFVPALLAVIFGAIALNQLSSNPAQQGRAQAIAGIVLGVVSMAFIVFAVAFAGDASFEVGLAFVDLF